MASTSLSRSSFITALVLVTIAVVPPAPREAAAEEWPAGPLTLLDGRVVVGGEALVTVGPEDRGFFNYTDYERSALQLARLGVVATVKATEQLSFVLDMRAEGDTAGGAWSGVPYAAYVRVRPWADRSLEVHAGRIPPAFGGFLRRAYGRDNPLIGYPLAYQYLTSLRADALPQHADDLIDRRGSGWYTGYPVGNPAWGRGLPMVSAFSYDTGALVRLGRASGPVEVLGSVTRGALSNPRGGDRNGPPQTAARVVTRPVVGLVIGASGAHGGFLSESLTPVLPPGTPSSRYAQRTFGADVEYSRDYWLLRAEWVRASWRLPALAAPWLADPIGAQALSIEGRYTIAPGLYAAARVDRLSFTSVRGTAYSTPWDARVSRLETGLGYALSRHVIVKTVYQYNRREGGRVPRAHLGAAQLLVWF